MGEWENGRVEVWKSGRVEAQEAEATQDCVANQETKQSFNDRITGKTTTESSTRRRQHTLKETTGEISILQHHPQKGTSWKLRLRSKLAARVFFALWLYFDWDRSSIHRASFYLPCFASGKAKVDLGSRRDQVRVQSLKRLNMLQIRLFSAEVLAHSYLSPRKHCSFFWTPKSLITWSALHSGLISNSLMRFPLLLTSIFT